MTKEQTMKNIRLSAAITVAFPLLAAGLLLVAGLLLAACGGRASQQETQDDGYVMELEVLSTTVGPAALEIALTGPDGAPVTDATLNVRGDMSHAGMVPVLQEGHTRNRQGIYNVPFEWTMAGDWIVTVEAGLPDGQMISRQFNLTVTGAMNGMQEATE
jgi:hypothetical protein